MADKAASFDRLTTELKELRREREKAINERYSLVMEINKKVTLLDERQQEAKELQEALDRAVGSLHSREKESARVELEGKRQLTLLD